MRIYKLVGIVLSALLLLVSCTNSDVDKKKVKIAYANWLEGIAMSHLAKVVLEEQGLRSRIAKRRPCSDFRIYVRKEIRCLFGCLVADNDERLLEPIRR